jgi:hypothetical protein
MKHHLKKTLNAGLIATLLAAGVTVVARYATRPRSILGLFFILEGTALLAFSMRPEEPSIRWYEELFGGSGGTPMRFLGLLFWGGLLALAVGSIISTR